MRWAVVLVSLVALVTGIGGAVRLAERSAADRGSTVREDSERLRDISTILRGSTLPPGRYACELYVHIDTVRNGYRYPAPGTRDYESITAHCAGSLP